MTYAVVVNWYGPYTSLAAAKRAISDPSLPSELLYLAVGTMKYQRNPILQYVGITKDFVVRFRAPHKVKLIKQEGLSLYLGQVTSQRRAGKKTAGDAKNFSKAIYLAESLMAFLLELPINSNKRCSPPKESIILVSRWWNTDLETRKRRRPHPDWPDFIEYDDDSEVATIAWHGLPKRTYLNSEALKEIPVRACAQIAAKRAKQAETEKRKKAAAKKKRQKKRSSST